MVTDAGYTCPIISDAGTMTAGTLTLCSAAAAPAIATATQSVPYVEDSDDAVMFILHTDASDVLGSEIARSCGNPGFGDADTPLTFGSASAPGVVVSGVTYNVHTFTSSGTITVIRPGLVQLLIVAGGGGAGAGRNSSTGGGGGGGGQIYTGLTISSTSAISIGNGGAGGTYDIPSGVASPGSAGQNTTVLGLTAIGGGYGGGSNNLGQAAGGNGGNGGGGGQVLAQGNGAVGLGTAGQGNNGVTNSGGSSNNQAGYSVGGFGGFNPSGGGTPGAANTGNGGEAGYNQNSGGAGGSGVVVITYPI
jgi:hypothetical protein